MKPQRLDFTCFFAGLFTLSALTGCSDDPVGQGNDETDPVIHKESVSGVAQKGPFIRGSNVILYELDTEDFSQTGRSFNATIKDDAWNFTIEDIQLTGLFAKLRADGYYFNEITGRESASQLVNHAVYLRPALIRKHLEERYSAIGATAEAPDFEQHIVEFLESTSFEITQRLFEYPEYGIHADNILDPDRTNYVSEYVSLPADPI